MEAIMRTVTKALLAFGAVAGAATLGITGTDSAKAQGVYIDAPGVHVGVGHRHHHRRYYRGYDAYDYDRSYAGPRRGGGFNTWNGCPPRYTIQDGVCKPYRGY
jgi:hypothetical protein